MDREDSERYLGGKRRYVDDLDDRRYKARGPGLFLEDLIFED
jgi:hypothetical protein